MNEDGSPSYHDLHITAAEIPRTSIFNLSYGLEVHCNRVTGWQLWDINQAERGSSLRGPTPSRGVLIAGEYDGADKWLVLDVGGHVIVDSRQRAESR